MSQINIPQQNFNNPNLNVKGEDNQEIISKINKSLKSIDFINPKGLIKQNVKNELGLNFKIFGNTFSRNIQVSPPENIYFLSHNLRSGLEKGQKEQITEDFYSKYNVQKFEQLSRNLLNREKDFYREFVDLNGNIGINELNLENNLASKLRKTYTNTPFNYMQENSEFDINNNKMGIFLLLNQNPHFIPKSEKGKNKLLIYTSFKRCNEHQRRRALKKTGKSQKPYKAFISPKKTQSPNILSKKRSLEDSISSKHDSYSTKQKKNVSNEQENNLFDKYLYSFIPYFKTLITNKKININDKILKLREVLDTLISLFGGGRRDFYELIKRVISPLNNNEKTNKLTTKILIGRVIKYLENDFERKNYISSNSNFDKKNEFISNYTKNILFTYFSNIMSYTKNQSIITLWAKIYYYIRLGWKKECIKFIALNETININESGLREIKESLEDSNKISIQNFNEFKRIISQEKKENNPFKHACMVYMTKESEPLYNNILLEINDHLWFNLNLIYPQDNYSNLIKKEEEDCEINTNSNKDNNNEKIKLFKLKELQKFFEDNQRELLNLNDKITIFSYIILLVGLLKFKTALNYMIANNMIIDSINFLFILKQLEIYSDFDEINENIIDFPQKIVNIEKREMEQIYQRIFPVISNNIPVLMIYIIFSDKNFIPSLSNLLVMNEEFGVLNNYDKLMQLFPNNNDIKSIDMINYNPSIKNFNFYLRDLIDEETFIKLCKKIFEVILSHKMSNYSNLIPLFNTFKNLKMLTESAGLLINKSIELLEVKKPVIKYDINGNISISNDNPNFFGNPLILNYFGALINDAIKLFIEKQNEAEDLIKNNHDDIYDEKIYDLTKETKENNIIISLLKQLPIIENIYEYIYMNNFDQAFRLYLENINIIKIDFEHQNKNEIENEFNESFQQILSKENYGLMDLYSDILYLFVWLFINHLKILQMKGYTGIINNLRNRGNTLVFISEKLEQLGQKEQKLRKYYEIFKKIKDEAYQIKQFYINFY